MSVIVLNNNSISTTGIYDTVLASTQQSINNRIPFIYYGGFGSEKILHCTTPRSARCGFLLYLGGAAGAWGSLWFINLYSANEYVVSPICDKGYSASIISGTTNLQIVGASDWGIVPLSYDAMKNLTVYAT